MYSVYIHIRSANIYYIKGKHSNFINICLEQFL